MSHEGDSSHRRINRRVVGGIVAGGLVVGTAVVVATQEDYPADNFTSMTGRQVEHMDILKDPLTAFARTLRGEWGTLVHPGSVSDVISGESDRRPYYIDADEALKRNTTETLTPYLEETLPPGIHQIALPEPDIQAFGEDATMLTRAQKPDNLTQRITYPDGSVNTVVYRAVMEANTTAFVKDDMTMPPDGFYPLYVTDLTAWMGDVSGMTAQQRDITIMQAADMLQGK